MAWVPYEKWKWELTCVRCKLGLRIFKAKSFEDAVKRAQEKFGWLTEPHVLCRTCQ